MTPDALGILQVTAPGDFGGRETVVADLSAALRERGHRVTVLAVLDEGTDAGTHPFVTALRSEEVEVRSVTLPPRAYRAEARAIRQAARDSKAGIVHSHGYRTDVVAALSGAVPGARLVSTAHGYTGGGRKNRLYERLQAAAWRRFGAVIAVSEPLVKELHRRGLDPRRVRLIPNAWRGDARSVDRPEARRRLGIESDARVVGWVGRITQEKGPDVALDAFARLAAREGAEAQQHFVGEGRLRPELESRAAALGLAERVHWHGAVASAARLFPAFDVLLLSSHTEGTPMVLFEAMAASVPIVATSVGGVPDVLGPGGGWLVPPRSPAALAAALEEALTSPVEAHSRVARATDRLNAKYAVGPWVDAHLALYRELAES